VNPDGGGAVRYNLDGSPSAQEADSQCVRGQEAQGCNFDDSLPTLAMALQGELGLKLVPTKMMVNSLVIDHIERPAIQ
jgi:uncharacterized protein (TIGR03435 family)